MNLGKDQEQNCEMFLGEAKREKNEGDALVRVYYRSSNLEVEAYFNNYQKYPKKKT